MKFHLALLIFFFLGTAVAQDIKTEKLDQFFDEIESHNRGMGSLSIYHNGSEVYQRSIGFENVSQSKKANHKTRYRVGSISKTFTAVVIMQLVEEGKLKLEDKLSDFYPQFKNASKITIKHLLQHRSGLFNFTNDPFYMSYMEQPKSKEELLKIMAANKHNFNPGEQMEYSNTGYVLLGFIAEDIDGLSLKEIYENRIIQPIGLTHTYYGGEIGAQDNEAFSYKLGDGWELATETDMSLPAGAGAVVSTPSDINKFYYNLFHHKLLSESSVEQMMTMKDNYGFGLFNFPFYDKVATGHNGGIDAFSSSAGHFLTEDMTITYISNGADWPTNNILIGVLSIYFDKDYEIPNLEKKIISEDILKSYVGVYSSPTFPLKITIALNGSILFAQATGQSAFILEPIGDHKFTFAQAGITITFEPENNMMSFTQGPGKYELKKE